MSLLRFGKQPHELGSAVELQQPFHERVLSYRVDGLTIVLFSNSAHRGSGWSSLGSIGGLSQRGQ